MDQHVGLAWPYYVPQDGNSRQEIIKICLAIAAFEGQINSGAVVLDPNTPKVVDRSQVKWPNFIDHNGLLVPVHWDGTAVTYDGGPYDFVTQQVVEAPKKSLRKPLPSREGYRNNSDKMPYRILLCYKNFSKECHVSHIGLGVTAAYTAKTLIQNGYRAEARPVFGGEDLLAFLEAEEQTAHPVTHVLIMAQWIPTKWLAKMARRFPTVKFALNCHSNIGFLAAEPPAITKVREAIDLETGLPNFFACTNNLRCTKSLQQMYGRPVQFLPNLYYLHGEEPIHRPRWNGGVLRIGCFGSLRTYKNFSSAISAAMQIGHMLRNPVEIWINSGRTDGFGNVIYRTARAWTDNVPGVELKELHWASWPEFKRHVGMMNLLLQPSYTETFNNVTADGVAEGVPSVVSDAIDWAPTSWMGSTDDASNIAEVGRKLLYDHHAAKEGYDSLKRYVRDGLHYWSKFLARP